ncbi:MAG: branched-chain amino acid ABC transporter permease [Anaerolineaceae bacterium]|nr:branched-chain amino acid ABC transporter permease [Anaerolineaceae bacterium]
MMKKSQITFFRKYRTLWIFFLVMLVLPFAIGLIEGSSPLEVWQNQGSYSKFIEGLGIEIFILALFALSYDLLFGITGLLSFGHAMFFATAAYMTGMILKFTQLPILAIFGLVIVLSVVQALLFSLVLPRVKGITFALITLGFASVFHIVITSTDLSKFTGSDVGLQGYTVPAFINPASEKLRFYVVALLILVVMFILYKTFVKSPTGRVCIAIRENEDRAKMLGFNSATFKILAMMISSFTAALAGMLHALYQPAVIPSVADLGFTVTGLLIVLIGGVGTLSGAIVGAFVFKLLDFGLRRFIGGSASFIIGSIYVLFVLFIPYGIVGTMQMRKFKTKAGWKDLLKRVGIKSSNDKQEPQD